MNIKIKLPGKISELMKLWRLGLICFPTSYIEFHKSLAEQELNRLKELGFMVIETTKIMKNDGWFDSMRVLNIKLVKDNTIFDLHWHDGSQVFFSRYESGGSSPLDVESRTVTYIVEPIEIDIMDVIL